MKLDRFGFVVLFFVTPLVLSAKPFRRVLVLSGGGFQSAVFTGMLSEAREMGWEPDLVISACGSSLGMTVPTIEPDSNAWLSFLESETYQGLLTSPRIEKNGFALISSALQLLRTADAQKRAKPGEELLPDLFRNYLMSVPTEFETKRLYQAFPTRGPRLLMVASRLRYGADEAGRKRGSRKTAQEVYFTDAETKVLLDELRISSPIAERFPDSFVQKETGALAGYPTLVAARASISDPYYMNPLPLGSETYLAGSIDLYPYELAKALGDEIMMTYSGFFDSVEQAAILTSFGYDNNVRLTSVRAQEDVDHWIDLSDTDRFYAKHGFNPRKVYKKIFGVQVPAEMAPGVPTDRAEYVARVRAQWSYGRCRVREALKAPARDKKHLGKPTCWE